MLPQVPSGVSAGDGDGDGDGDSDGDSDGDGSGDGLVLGQFRSFSSYVVFLKSSL